MSKLSAISMIVFFNFVVFGSAGVKKDLESNSKDSFSEITDENINDTPQLIAPDEFNKMKMNDDEMKVLKNEINTLGKKITAQLKEKQMKGIVIESNASVLKFWADNVNIEEATGRNSQWYKKVTSQLEKLAYYKSRMEVYQLHDMKEEYNEVDNDYNDELSNYLNIIHRNQ